MISSTSVNNFTNIIKILIFYSCQPLLVGLGSIILGLIFLHIIGTPLNDNSEIWACNVRIRGYCSDHPYLRGHHAIGRSMGWTESWTLSDN